MKKAVVLFLVTVLFLTACSEEETQYPNPNDTADEYMEQWMEYDFEKLYENYLSRANKINFFIKKIFVERYNHLYEALSCGASYH